MVREETVKKNKEQAGLYRPAVRELGIYIHIPFCVRKCSYCDFLSMPAGEDVIEDYIRVLCDEIRGFQPGRYCRAIDRNDADLTDADPQMIYHPVSVFLGGGTPSILSGRQITRILDAVEEKFHIRKSAVFYKGAAGENTGSCEDAADKSAGSYEGTADENAGSCKVAANEKRTQGASQECTGNMCPLPEITVECNPGTLDEEKLKAMRKAGVNRLSIGLQSADNEELKILGRIHTWEEFEENILAARKVGFDNISVDLMSALPGQTIQSWKETLGEVLSFRPKHLSAYSLIIEEGTPFYELYHEEDELRHEGQVLPDRQLPTEEEERRMYEETARILAEAGLERYEISNYAVPGYESIHNSGYWERRDYIGFGLGASSCMNGIRFKNTADLNVYLAGGRGEQRASFGSKEDVTYLTREDEISETLFLGLRMTKGVDLAAFEQRFGEKAEDLFSKPIKKYRELGLLEQSGGRLFLTQEGLFVSNTVMAEFLL